MKLNAATRLTLTADREKILTLELKLEKLKKTKPKKEQGEQAMRSFDTKVKLLQNQLDKAREEK